MARSGLALVAAPVFAASLAACTSLMGDFSVSAVDAGAIAPTGTSAISADHDAGAGAPTPRAVSSEEASLPDVRPASPEAGEPSSDGAESADAAEAVGTDGALSAAADATTTQATDATVDVPDDGADGRLATWITDAAFDTTNALDPSHASPTEASANASDAATCFAACTDGPAVDSPDTDALDVAPPDDAPPESSACTGAACQVCTSGATRCASSADVQTCTATGTWGPSLPCPFVCSNGGCAGVCTPGSTQCAFDTTLGSAGTRTCDATGQWGAPSACCFTCNTDGTACAPDSCASQCTRVASGDTSCASVSGAAYPYYWVCTGSCATTGPASCGNNGTAQGASRLNSFPAGAFCGSCAALCGQ